MEQAKDTRRALVRVGFDGRVHKRYRGTLARERMQNEVKVLKYLESKGCDFVPKLLEVNEDELLVVTSNCGRIVEHISEEKLAEIFAELESFGIRHEDAFARNVTYNPQLGRFCLIDFEFATFLDTGEGLRADDPRFHTFKPNAET